MYAQTCVCTDGVQMNSERNAEGMLKEWGRCGKGGGRCSEVWGGVVRCREGAVRCGKVWGGVVWGRCSEVWKGVGRCGVGKVQ